MTGPSDTDLVITGTPFRPSEEFYEVLVAALKSTVVEETGSEEFEPADGATVEQFHYDVTLDGETIHSTETYSPVGVLASAEGNLGIASGYLLGLSLKLGVPSHVYTDEVVTSDEMPVYQDVTAEWYRPAVSESGVAEDRLASKTATRANEVEFGELKQWLVKFLDTLS